MAVNQCHSVNVCDILYTNFTLTEYCPKEIENDFTGKAPAAGE